MSLQQFLDDTMASFIGASISRVTVTGDLAYRYRLSAHEVKEAARVQRLHDSEVSEYMRNNFNVQVSYDRNATSFFIDIDLTRAILNPREAEFLSAAMETFRRNHL